MFIDASALTAILADEPDAPALLARMNNRPTRLTSPTAVWESAIAVARVLNLPIPEASAAVEQFLALADIKVVAIDAEVRHAAIEAYDRFGKSRHPAALNFGDCFAYACARHAGMPLLYKGEDFPLTDIEAA